VVTVRRWLGWAQVAWNSAKDSGRQRGVQGQPGSRVQVQPVTLPPGDQAGVAFVDGDVGAGPQQALGESEPAKAAAGHRDPQRSHAANLGNALAMRLATTARPR
jgi:hypothetical protein